MEISCPRCKNPICDVAGGHAVMTYRRRSYAMRDLLWVQCERCDFGWAPRYPGAPDLPPIDRVPTVTEDDLAELICPTMTCMDKVLATLIRDMAIIAYGHRSIVARHLEYAQCDQCGRGVQPVPAVK